MENRARCIEKSLEHIINPRSEKDKFRAEEVEKKLLKLCLYERKKLLNEKFVWTEEAKASILRLNVALFEADKLVNEEYDKRKLELEAREKSGDKFLTDYNIDKKISMMILTLGEDGEWEEPWEGIYDILNNFIGSHSINATSITSDLPLPNEEPLNWNTTLGAAYEHFRDNFIHYGLHCLCKHTPLAWEDISKIRSLWTEVKVDYQRITDLF